MGKEWHQRILARHPELAITYRDVPDDRNGLLHWMELMKRLKADHPDKPISLDFPEEFSQHFRKKQNWNPVAARSWLDANRTLLDEIRAIGLMPDQSAKGIDPASRPWSMSLDSAKALLMDAHLAAEQGDTARALESVRAANGLANHLKRSESPLMIDVIYGSSIQQKIQEYVFSAILPSLPAGQTDIAAWENAVNPTLQQPGDFSRIIKGEWNGTMPTELLPAMSDSTDPHNPSDPEALAEAFTLNMENIARQNDDITLAELPDNPTPQADLSKLSWRSRELANDLGMSGQYDSRRYWARYQVSTGMTQAAFAILKGQPVPNDPVSGQPYTWDPATRILSAPTGKDFERMRIQLTLPKF